ncbi:MAG: hypothetical protein LBB18_02640, partial [Puniceicoccales bacterium]|nr:hypothetical protein [Puniceicoccales bacterium]
MKRTSIVAVCLLSVAAVCVGETEAKKASEPGGLSADVEVRFETEHTEHGRRGMRKAFLPKAEIKYPFSSEGRAYAGVKAALGLGPVYIVDVCLDSVSPYAGISYDVTDIFTVDIGYMHRLYTSAPAFKFAGIIGTALDYDGSGIKRNASEVYGAVYADVFLSPSLRVFYNFLDREIDVEVAIGHSFDLSQNVMMGGISLDLGAKVGYVN